MQVKPENRCTFGLNAKKALYTGPCLNRYQAFKGVLPSTGGKQISDTVKFQHHTIDTPTLTNCKTQYTSSQREHQWTNYAPLSSFESDAWRENNIPPEEQCPNPTATPTPSATRRTHVKTNHTTRPCFYSLTSASNHPRLQRRGRNIAQARR